MNKLVLNKVPFEKWFKNLQVFLAPVIVLYLTTIIGVVSQDGHKFIINDLLPNSFAWGGIVLWFLNIALDYFRKLRS